MGGRARLAWYGAIVFLTSAGALVVEIVAARLIAPHAGSSLYTWTAIIAAVLAGLSVGHWIGGRLAGAEVDARRGERRMAGALAFAALTSLGALILLRLLADAVGRSSAGAFVAVTALGAALFFLPSLCAGIVSPIATKLAVDLDPSRTGPAIGTLSAAGAVGSILGTVLAGFVLVQWIGSSATLIATALMYAALAVVLFATRPRALLLLLPAAGLAAFAAPRFAAPCQVESAYYCINVVPGNAVSDRPSRILLLNQMLHSHVDRDDPGRLLLGYARLGQSLAEARVPADRPPRAFVLGGGGFALPRAWAHRFPEGRITVAEIDPALVSVATGELWLEPGPALDIRIEDGRQALRRFPPGPTFDLMFTDAFTDAAVPFHLVTREMVRLAAERLAPNGIVVLNMIDRPEAPRLVASILKTLAADFPHRALWREIPYGTAFAQYLIAAAATPIADPAATPEGWTRASEGDRAALESSPEAMLLTDDLAPIERLLQRFCSLERIGLRPPSETCRREGA